MSNTSYFFLVVFAASLMTFAFQGTRGIWEPDEGFYIGSAYSMVTTGDWVIPQFYLRPFLDKPPLVYWGSALGMDLFGINEWSARLAHSIWYILTVWVVGRLGRRMWTSRTGIIAAAVYAFSPVPFIASNIVTPDTPLSFWITAAMYCFWRSTHSEWGSRPWIWTVAWGVCQGMACLAKGPAALVFLAPMGAYLIFTRTLTRYVISWPFLLGLLFFVAIGGSWYAAIFWMIPGAWSYVIDNQIVGRLVSERYNRNPGVFAPFYVYLPILLFGMLPWSVAWYPMVHSRWKHFLSWNHWNPFRIEDRCLFLVLWIGLPLFVFCSATSRLPLYILPVFASLSLVTARCIEIWKPIWVSLPLDRPRTLCLFTWLLVLLIAKGVVALWPTSRDSRAVWIGIKDLLPSGSCEIVAVNARRHGLSFYSRGDVEWVSTRESPYPFFFGPDRFEDELHEHLTSPRRHVYLVREREHASVTEALRERQVHFERRKGPFDYSLFICEPNPRKEKTVRLAALGDTRTGNSMQVQLASAIYHLDRENPLDGIILLGDNISFTGDPADMDDNFTKPFDSLIRGGIRFFAVLGNHDVGPHTSFQMNHPLFNMGGHRYYSRTFRDGVVQCFFLDSNIIVNDIPQVEWLRKELLKNTTQWKLVAMHFPIHGSTERRPLADPGLAKILEPVFIEGGIDIVLSGHNHIFARYQPRQGIHYFTAGSGGRVDRGILPENDPSLLAGNDETTIALMFRFTENECEFTAVNAVEEILDRGMIDNR